MRAFGWWIGLCAAEVAGCLVAVLVAQARGYPEAADAFVRCALVLAATGVASCVALAVFILWVRARAKAVS